MWWDFQVLESLGFSNPWVNVCLFLPLFWFNNFSSLHSLNIYWGPVMERGQGAVDCLQSLNFDCKKWLFTVIKSSMLKGPVLGITGLGVKKKWVTFSLLYSREYGSSSSTFGSSLSTLPAMPSWLFPALLCFNHLSQPVHIHFLLEACAERVQI